MKVFYENNNVFVSSTLKNNLILPKSFKNIPFEKIRDDILGKKYEVSINLIGKDRSKTLNNNYRKKNYATDVLAFELSTLSGEIFITPAVAKTKAPKFEMSYENYLLFLVIHAMLHLKGFDHGMKMEKLEKKYLLNFLNK